MNETLATYFGVDPGKPDGARTLMLTGRHIVALQLLARGGARYGTMYEQMAELRDMGLCAAQQKLGKIVNGKEVGGWIWRPTTLGRAIIMEKGIVACG